MKKKYFVYLDIIRVLSLIVVLLFHMNILKGGYLAVCSFFVLSGYLAVVTFNNKEPSLKEYYINKIKKIYLPLLVVVFTTIAISSILHLDWINLKAETRSVILAYNNYWQLNANLDYFVRNVTSPFTHLWFIAITLQFELLFPFIYKLLNKIKEKTNKNIIYILLGIISLLSIVIFTYKILNNNLMSAYYGTFSRSYSLILGIILGFIHLNQKDDKKINIKDNTIRFYSCIILLVLLFIFIDFKSFLFTPTMIITTLLTLQCINSGIKLDDSKLTNYIKPISKISYEIYLVQYPIIYFFQLLKLNIFISIPLTIITIIILSIILHIVFDNKKNKYLRLSIGLIFMGLSIYGCFNYVIAKDNTKDQKKLQNDLLENSRLIEKKQKEFALKMKSDQENYNNLLNDLENSEKNLGEVVTNMKIVGIGDSIMELAIKNLYGVFPNGYFDAVENRTEHQAKSIIEDLKNQGLLGDVLLLNIGTNGSCLGQCKEELMDIIGDRKVYWLNATNPDYDTFNPSLYDIAEKHSNIKIIDWVSVANEHPEYLIYDKVHPTVTGCRIYAETIYNAIYDDTLKDLQAKKEEALKQHEEEQNKKVTFIGNDLLIGGYDFLSEEFPESNFISDKELTYKKLIDIIDKNKKEETISNNLVLMIDQRLKLSDKEYKEIIKKTIEYHLLVVEMNKYNKLNNVKTIKFYEEIEKHPEYLSYDNIHLTEKGYKVLTSKIKDSISE